MFVHLTFRSYHCVPVVQGDEFGSLAEFHAPNLAVKYSFSNFSFKVRSASPSYSLFIIKEL